MTDYGHDLLFGSFVTPAAKVPDQVVELAQLSEQAGLDKFYAPSEVRTREFENTQRVDWDGLKGRLMSASYAPKPGDPKHEPMIKDFEKLFAAHQTDGKVLILYRTRVYFGQLGPRAGRKDG